MEVSLTRSDATASQVTVTCDGQVSHIFDLDTANSLPHPMKNPIAYGKALYQALFPPGSPSRKTLTQERERILLVAHDELLDAIAWEYLYGPDGFVVCDVPFVRGLPPEQRIPTPERVGGLHILAVPSNPLHPQLAPLDIEDEWMRLVDSVLGLTSAVILERVWPPTSERLRALVANQQQRVVHFMGHGGKNERGEAMLCFERENGTLEPVSARELVKRLRGSVLLVTLNACKSAEPGESLFSNLGAALVRERVPYVLGMRFQIHDDDALTFSRVFYDNLARGVPVEEAVFQMRLSLQKSDRPWAIGVAVLYTALTEPAPGFATEPGTPVVSTPQKAALSNMIGVLPQTEGAFQGRLDEQITLGNALTGNQRPRILTIHGSGGQGKTALARVAVERFAHAWSGGVWAISLEHLPPKVLFVERLACFLGINLQEIAEAAELEKQVLLRLHDRRTLIVLDNAETLIEAVEAADADPLSLAQFIQQLPTPPVSLLATSRRFFGWSGEKPLELKGLSPAEGAALFHQNIPQRLDEFDPVQAWRLSERLDGHPLSLFLLGRTFNEGESSVPLSAFITEYEAQLLTAQDKYKGVDHRQRKLYASIETSVQYLSPGLRHMFSQLWLFHASFLPEVATAILDPEHEAQEEGSSLIAAQLHTLWQRGLLTRDEAEGRVLYRVPPVIRPYLERYLATESERTPLLARYGSTYAKLVQYIYRELDRGPLASTLAVLCSDDLERGKEQVSEIEQGRYLLLWGWILHRLGNRIQGMTVIEQALELGQERDQSLMLFAMNYMAEVYRATGRSQDALRLHEQALPIMRNVDDQAGQAATLNNMATVYRAISRPQDALPLYEQALSIMQEMHDRAGEAATLSNIAEVCRLTGRLQDALRLYEQALPVAKEMGDRAREAVMLNNMAAVERAIGRLQDALQHYEQALPIMQEVGDRAGEAATLNDKAGVYRVTGRLQDALRLYKQALSIRREVGDRAGEGATLNNMAEVYRVTGRLQDAMYFYEQALLLAREVDHHSGEAATLANMAVLLHQEQRLQEAIASMEQALAILHATGLPQDAAGQTREQLEQMLQTMQAQEGHPGNAT